MQLTNLGRIFRRSLWLIILTTLVGGAIALLLAVNQRPVYAATGKMLFSPSTAAASSTGELVAANTVLGSRITTYMTLVNSPLILDPVIQSLGLDATAGQLSSSVAAATAGAPNIVAVTASSSDPASAAALANAVAESLATQVTATETSPDAEATGPTLVATLVEPAAAPSAPSAPDIGLMLAIGLAIGFAIGVVIAAIRAYTDSRIRTRQDIHAATDAATIVGGLDKAATRTFVVAAAPTGGLAEAYRQFRAQLRTNPETQAARTIVVTSPTREPAVVGAAANLAAVIAEEDVRVALVDADIRNGLVAQFVDVTSPVGVSDVLGRRSELKAALVETAVPQLRTATAGTPTDSPYPLFASPTMGTLVEELKKTVDVVVIVAPALLDHAETLLLASNADESVLVVDSGRSRKKDLREAYALLESSGAPVTGVLLADVPRRGPDAHWR
ncbi:Wzz/FepE/Etk N-terminal domain-containing protein [Microbacterium pumilum]|uniref:Polysaccharide chain length determinant N-terminal domain-containing protein n=1 Tax=Microbacterium pumilum TaxID=344165 RepID=A0ABN2SAQ6_9MICO